MIPIWVPMGIPPSATKVGYGAGTGVGHSKFTCGWPMLITPAEECGRTRCAHCFFLSFCPLIRELQGQGGQPLLVIHIWDHFEPTERENPLCCVLLGDFEQTGRGLSLSMLRLVWTNRRGNPSCCILLDYWEGKTLLVIHTYLGRFEPMERVSPPCWVLGAFWTEKGKSFLLSAFRTNWMCFVGPFWYAHYLFLFFSC